MQCCPGTPGRPLQKPSGVTVAAEKRNLKEEQTAVPDGRSAAEQRQHQPRDEWLDDEDQESAQEHGDRKRTRDDHH
jgi:hypothetical protein